VELFVGQALDQLRKNSLAIVHPTMLAAADPDVPDEIWAISISNRSQSQLSITLFRTMS
jgi:hypothetical protein